MNSNKNKPVTNGMAAPSKGYGYVPKYTPPDEPVVPPAPKVETHVDIPSTMEMTTLEDLISRVHANASILYPGLSVKVTTAVSPSGLMCHALIVSPKNEESAHSRYKVLLKGIGVAGDKKHPAAGRRSAVQALLEDTERRIGKELLGS